MTAMRAILALSLVPLAAAECTIGYGDGSFECACYMFPCADITTMGTTTVEKDLTGSATGKITGKTNGVVDMYLGVPVAAPATGANRFNAPQPTTWTGTVEATKESPCPVWMYPIAGSESCLTVDIYTPTGSVDLPIALWIHGGGFAAQNPYFNLFPMAGGFGFQSTVSTALPNDGKAVGMIIHYRLGALGWMSHPGFVSTADPGLPGFTGTGPNPGAGNYGMMDTLNAVKFAFDNAAAFGGDSSKITVFGESAGAAHVMSLMASPLSAFGATPLVKTFIAQSPYISFSGATFSMKARQQMGVLYTLRAGCTTATTVATGTALIGEVNCLRAASVMDLIQDTGFGGPAAGGPAASTTAVSAFDDAYGPMAAELFTYNTIHIWPVVDGYVITQAPLDAYASINADINLVVGHNADEYTTFCYMPSFSSFACAAAPDPMNEAWVLALYGMGADSDYATMYAAIMGAVGAESTSGSKMFALHAGQYYNDIVDGPAPLEKTASVAVQMGTDAWFTNGNAAIVDARGALAGTKTYHYVYAEDTDFGMFPVMGACHGCELTFVLGFYKLGFTYITSMVPSAPATDFTNMMSVGIAMNTYWSSIFYTGDPNGDSTLPEWKTTGTTFASKNTMVFQSTYAKGAALNPCVQFLACRIEPTKDFRSARKAYFNSPLDSAPGTPDTCGSITLTGSFSNKAQTTVCPAQAPHTCKSHKTVSDGSTISGHDSSETTPNDGKCCDKSSGSSDYCGYEVHQDKCIHFKGTQCTISPATGRRLSESSPESAHLKTETTCAKWCNSYTCGVDVCKECDSCLDLAAGQMCASWCNSWTCGDAFPHCKGCSSCSHSASTCDDWCNAYTCGFDRCSSCATCKKVSAGEYCASWCSSYTCGGFFTHCMGCASCGYA